MFLTPVFSQESHSISSFIEEVDGLKYEILGIIDSYKATFERVEEQASGLNPMSLRQQSLLAEAILEIEEKLNKIASIKAPLGFEEFHAMSVKRSRQLLVDFKSSLKKVQTLDQFSSYWRRFFLELTTMIYDLKEERDRILQRRM